MASRINEALGVKYPIVQSPMAWVATPPLVAAVCNAGGLGLLSASGQTPEALREEIHEVRRLTGNKPFGVNLVPVSPKYKEQFRVVLEEKIEILNSGLRNPFVMHKMKKPAGVFYIPTVGSVRQALSVEKFGADAVIVQGWEGGGHASGIASMVLIPEVSGAVKIPVVAAGGFSDGRGLAAALALGAAGIAMGTRFATTQESPIPMKLKEKYVEARDSDAILSRNWDGFAMRVIPGAKMRRYRGWWTHPWDVIPSLFAAKRAYNADWKDMIETAKGAMEVHANLIQFLVGLEMNRQAILTGDIEHSFSPSGQVAGRIVDIPTCKELMDRIANEAEEVIKGLAALPITGK